MASLGGLTSLERMDLTGCRDHERLTERIWTAIRARRAALEEAHGEDVDHAAERLLEEARKLRDAAERLLRRAAELERQALTRRR